MRVAHLLGALQLPCDPDAQGASGVVRAALELAAAQVALGHEVTVAATAHRPWRGVWRGVRLRGLAKAPWARLRLGGRAIDLTRHLPFVALTLAEPFDVVHGHLHSYMRGLRARARVVHFHTDPYHDGGNDEGLDMKPTDFLTVARYSHAQIAVSTFVARELERGLPDSATIHVVHNGVYAEAFAEAARGAGRAARRAAWGLPADATVVLYAGALVPEKGVLTLAQAFAGISGACPDLRLVLAGSSDLWGQADIPQGPAAAYEVEVRAALAPLVAAGRVRFLGRVPAADMPAVYAASDLVAVPSTWREPFPMVVLEALAAGRPVVASNVGGLPEAAGPPAGLLVPPNDPAALGKALSRLAGDASLRRRMGDQGRRRAAVFTWASAARHLDVAYRSSILRLPARQGSVI